jgi:hypothetical protein
VSGFVELFDKGFDKKKTLGQNSPTLGKRQDLLPDYFKK